ncbi:AraC family transcriptional regulator [Bacillus chungangensis]|uniref:AraC family transcriptional regulator n=1 Tax=Bacillus chungangensis TaxID=587633 RepID=A0ABT9WYL1_9BACI|nr:AraC family transcriptional regulator [Bacillus chungangensis]MDQ0177962.1 AraC family transcriptional regulator [Bacillus chungangensis]
MEALQRMNDSLDYMEQHLVDAFSIEEAAALSCMSKFHFQRMFQMLTGMTVGEYMRKRRLTLAAQDLANSQMKVIEAALKYGYESPESFSKAFRKLHSISPSEARSSGQLLKAFPRLSFHIQLKGAIEMNYKLVEKEAFTIAGKGLRLKMGDKKNNEVIPAFWEECNTNGFSERLEQHAGELGVVGACMDFDHEAEMFTYFIGAEDTSKHMDDHSELKNIPAATWGVFEVIGPMPNAIQEAWQRIFHEWFPSTGYEHAGGMEFEAYSPGDPFADDYRTEIWVPVIKKK